MERKRTTTHIALLLGLIVLLLPMLTLISTATHAQTQITIRIIYFPQTGHYLRGQFLDFWEANGGERLFGYPVTEEYVRNSDKMLVQYFERARFELHVDGTQGTVHLGNLGTELLTMQNSFHPPVPHVADRRYFPETGHTLHGGFRTFWETNNGAFFFGAPITEEFLEIVPDGTQRTVQYFERARFELHGNQVQLGRLGELLAPCHMTTPRPPDSPPLLPIPEGRDTEPCERPNVIATGYVYPSPVAPGTIQGFDARGFRPGEVVSLWLNMPGAQVRGLPYTATADEHGRVIIGFQTQPGDTLGYWELVAQGVRSKRLVVAPFFLQ